MARTKEQKKEIVSKLETLMASAQSLVFVKFHGLKVSDATALRRSLRKEQVGLFVAKKSLVGRALETKKYAGALPALSGELALAYGSDLIAPARGVYEFEKKMKGEIAIQGGVFQGRYLSKEEMVAIAAIPPLATLRGMFVNVINSPIQGLVVSLDAIAKTKTA